MTGSFDIQSRTFTPTILSGVIEVDRVESDDLVLRISSWRRFYSDILCAARNDDYVFKRTYVGEIAWDQGSGKNLPTGLLSI